MVFDLDKLTKKFNKINKDKNEIDITLKNIYNIFNNVKESRELKYLNLTGFDLLYEKENDKYHDLIDSFSKPYLKMSRTLYVGEDLPKDYLNEIDELYCLFVLSFLFKYELEYFWENRQQIQLFVKLINQK